MEMEIFKQVYQPCQHNYKFSHYEYDFKSTNNVKYAVMICKNCGRRVKQIISSDDITGSSGNITII